MGEAVDPTTDTPLTRELDMPTPPREPNERELAMIALIGGAERARRMREEQLHEPRPATAFGRSGVLLLDRLTNNDELDES